MPEDTFPQAPTRADILRWLAANSDISPESVVDMTDDVVVAITARQDGRGAGRAIRMTLREEVINPDAAAAWGGRSIQLDLDLDCSRHRVILGARRIYARPNLQGSARITRPDNAWAEVPSDTVIDDVAKIACKSPGQLAEAQPMPAESEAATVPAATAAPPVQAAAKEAPELAKAPAPPPAAAAPEAAPVQLAAAEPPGPRLVLFDPPSDPVPKAAEPRPGQQAAARAPEAPVQLAAADPPPSPKVVHLDPPAEPQAAAAVTLAAPSGSAVVVAPNEPASPPEAQGAAADQPAVVHNPFVVADTRGPAGKAAGGNTPVSTAPSQAPAPRPPEFAVQIAAVASADLARDSWVSLKAKLPTLVAPRTFAVEPVEAKGRTLYRALLLGFASPDEAADLCKALRNRSVDCILRRMK